MKSTKVQTFGTYTRTSELFYLCAYTEIIELAE